MSVLALVIILLFLAGIAYLVNVYVPATNGTIKWLINLVLIIVAIVLVLQAFGVWQEVKGVQVPKI